MDLINDNDNEYIYGGEVCKVSLCISTDERCVRLVSVWGDGTGGNGYPGTSLCRYIYGAVHYTHLHS